ncbi:levanase [Spiroplasma chinense]|uniref:Levanase n=1 Tax=Spiroplasma chinense TaxID=216932 RepID=A0A5B9Y5F8_9MOLU|nr:glycoside hydrolase family 32 protein [Spiroplasma chinense]QEH61929.1 levanase [Spiroplasma chinense]
MKKILNSLASLTFASSLTTNVLACNANNDSFTVLKEIDMVDGDKKLETEKFVNSFHVDTPTRIENGKTYNGMINDVQGALFDGEFWNVYFLNNSESTFDDEGKQLGGEGTDWYRMKTKDFIHWEQGGVAVKKWHKWGDAASGSIFFDKDKDFSNKGGYVSLVTAYGGERGQNIMAFQSDDGINFSPLNNEEPILKNGEPDGSYPNFRDPLIIKRNGLFTMYLAQGEEFGIWSSSNPLSGYKRVGTYKPLYGMLECPALYKMNVNGDVNNQKWMMIYSGNGNNTWFKPKKSDKLSTGMYYTVGTLDENNIFKEEQEAKRIDFGSDFYAAKFWNQQNASSDIEEGQNSLLGMGWMSNWDYATKTPSIGKWGNLSIAREIKLNYVNNFYDVSSTFVDLKNQVEAIQGTDSDFENNKLNSRSYQLDLDIENLNSNKDILEFKLGNSFFENKIRLNFKKNEITSSRTSQYKTLIKNSGYLQSRSYKANIKNKTDIQIKLIVDTTTIEAQMPDGSTISMVKFSDEKENEKLVLQSSSEIKVNYKYYNFKL